MEKETLLSLMQDQQIAEELSKTFPQMDKYLYSKTKRPTMTGVELTALAQRIVNDLIGKSCENAPKRKERADMRKCTIRIPADVIGRLQLQMNAFGVNELNTIVNMMICRGLEEVEAFDKSIEIEMCGMPCVADGHCSYRSNEEDTDSICNEMCGVGGRGA